MFRFIALATAVVTCIPVFADEPTSAPTSGPSTPQSIAGQYAVALTSQKFDRCVAMEDATMKAALPIDKLDGLWKQLTAQCGEFKGFGRHRSEKRGEATAIIFSGQWKNTALDMHVVINPQGQVSGLWFKPTEVSYDFKRPAYINTSLFSSKPITVNEKPWDLPGMIAVPFEKSKKPAVVLVHGSGPNDMDETIGPNKPFRDIAEGLASQGIVVLRYEKRTRAHGAAMVGRPITLFDEVIDDALAAIKLARSNPDVNPSRVYLLGHSLGGCLAPYIARKDGKLAGVIVLSGTLRSMSDVILDQTEYIAATPGFSQEGTKQALPELRKNIAKVKAPSGNEEVSMLGAPIGYWRHVEKFIGNESLEAARSLTIPTLVLGGGRDYQITRKDFDLWQKTLKGKKNVTLEWLPWANHLYGRGKAMAKPEEYGEAHPVDEELIKGLTEWIKTGKYPSHK